MSCIQKKIGKKSMTFNLLTLNFCGQRSQLNKKSYLFRASYPMGTGGKAAGEWSWPLTSN
jgi:hypothetical protein